MRFLANALLALGLLVAAPAASPAWAQQEPPARVGRVAVVNGELGFHGTGETAWSKASLNFPVAAGASFWTDPKSRAELRVGSRSIALAGNTELAVAKLDQQMMQLALKQGRIDLHVRTLLEGESIEVDLPKGAVWILEPGIYDIDAGGPDQPERIAVFEGSARFVGGSLDVAVKAGDAAVISGAQTLTAAIEKANADDFAKWCRANDYDQRRLAAPYHVSPQMTGYEALDEYGSWRTVAHYGNAWFPRSVPMGWVPYRDGYWSWVEPWGWNWIDGEPWGFAPFHYGRWAYVDGLWGWVPGDYVPYPVYAPALVGWVSDPAAIVTAAAVGALTGWFPLGPGEAYWPSYTNDSRYIGAVNAGIAGDPRNLGARPSGDPASANQNFANRRFATVVPQQTFAAAQPIGRSALPIADPKAQHARVTAQAPAAPAGAGGARGGGHAGAASATGGMHGAAAAAAGVAAGAKAAAAGPRGPAGRVAAGRAAAGPRASRVAMPRAGSLRAAHVAAPRMAHAAPHMSAPRIARAAPHFAAPHAARMAAPRMAAPRGPVAHLGGGMPHGGGPAFHLGGGGGAPHGGGGGAPHGGGGGAPHGGGGGAPHGGGGGGGGKGKH